MAEVKDKLVTVESVKTIYDTLNTNLSSHTGNKSNPHSITKSQVGLGNVDNTSDMNKPVSTAQQQAISEARQAGVNAASNAQTTASNAQTAATRAQQTADNAQTAATRAQQTADNAKTAADNAQATADRKTSYFSSVVTLQPNNSNWINKRQTANVQGVTTDTSQPIFVSPNTESKLNYNLYGIEPIEQGNNTITFICEIIPIESITVNVVGFTFN